MRCEPSEVDQAEERFYVMAMIELTVYGHTVDRWIKEHYPEDWPLTLESRKHGSEWGCWHSVACPDGELGSNSVGALRPIEFEAFAFAREHDWPYVSDYTTLAPVMAVGQLGDDGRFIWNWSSLEDSLGERNQG